MRLREDYRQRMGDQFRLGEFHDRLLSYGMPPIKILRMALLGEAGGEMNATMNEPTEDQTRAVEFTVLATGTMSAHEGGRAVELIMNQDEWQRTWSIIGADRPAPDVNFTTQAVVVAFQGQRPTGGYGISVRSIRRDGTVLAVSVEERRPASGDVTTQVITSPFVAVSIPRPAAGTSVKFADEAGATKPAPRRVLPTRRRGVRRR